jgi:hypothetical protein
MPQMSKQEQPISEMISLMQSAKFLDSFRSDYIYVYISLQQQQRELAENHNSMRVMD